MKLASMMVERSNLQGVRMASNSAAPSQTIGMPGVPWMHNEARLCPGEPHAECRTRHAPLPAWFDPDNAPTPTRVLGDR